MSFSQKVVLLLTHTGDFFTVDRVAEALLKRGAKPFRFNTDQFPLNIQLAAELSNEGLNYCLKYGDESINSEQVQAVWMRRVWQPQLAQELDPAFQEACIRESFATLDGFFDSLRKARWVDDRERISAAENKLRQLRLATEVGLRIPQTLVTNDPQKVRDFFQALEGKIVAKLLTPLSYAMEGSSFFVYTSPVKAEDLLEAETLRYSPMIFQQQIPKQRELRIIFVSGTLFIGALDASRYSSETMDWRKAKSQSCSWESGKLPDQVTNCLKSFMAQLGLSFGAIDMIETPDGDYFFLEVNPVGEWGMIERDLGYPISEAIAETLLH